MTKYLPDTNVFSQVLKGNSTVTTFIEHLEIVVDATIYIECLQGSKSNQEKRIVKKVLDNFPLILVDADISSRAIELIDTYSNTHGLLLADALIAATSLENALTILTYNIDDFKFIKGLKCQKPPI